ncbi:MAG: putative metal-dependent hydrolase, TIM-barrel fold [Chloroflexi bacterium]|jgi:predicted TIM-barrel fold metal-dependent hydrolase|nr:MAG: putative metal-dependent hydrolase, TIM-barrel fold [Chloroflexota bacterium]
MTDLGFISSDSHMSEPLDLWVERMDSKYRSRAPHAVPEHKGKPGAWWTYEGYPPHNLAVGVAAGESRARGEQTEFLKGGTYADARPGGWDPALRLKDMEVDGVVGEVLYTTLGFRLFWLLDPDLQRECFRVYNDWLAEFCSYSPDRFKGLALISLYDPQLGAKELERCAKMGLSGAMIWVTPPEDRPYSLDVYDVFWAQAQETNMPLSLHPPTGMLRPKLEFEPEKRALRHTFAAQEVQLALSTIIISGVLERFPQLKMVSAEYDIGWVPYWLQQIDRSASGPRSYNSGFPTALTMKPSDYFHRQCYATYIDDPAGIPYRRDVGLDSVMWSSDYPHAASIWPKSKEYIARDFADSPEEEKWQIVRGNVSKLYGFDL